MVSPSIEIMILITGISVVFFVLIILTFIIKLFGTIISKIDFKRNNRESEMSNNIDCNINEKLENKDVISDEIVAVISAVVCDLYSENDRKRVVFKSIRRVNNKSNNMWGLVRCSKDITDTFN